MDWESLLAYTNFHPRWFESWDRHPVGPPNLSAWRALAPEGWKISRSGPWLVAAPPGPSRRREQGWKLHVTTEVGGSAETLRIALPFLLAAEVPFKFLADAGAVQIMWDKNSSRTASGKFITVYPADDAEFLHLGETLSEALAGRGGPYILTDRRWPGSTAVYYRYGAFTAAPDLTPDGLRQPMLTAPDGSKTSDVRNPYFSPPPWVADPFPEDVVDETDSELLGGRFIVCGALGYSNRGGVYFGIDTATGADVVLKEARPGTVVGSAGSAATEVLAKEYAILVMLAETGMFVRPINYFEEHGHAFLAEERLPGVPYGRYCVSRNPVLSMSLDPKSLRAYFRAQRLVWRQIARAILAAHERGILLGDLSYTNVLVDAETLDVTIIDLECAVREGIDSHLGVRTIGVASPAVVSTGRYDHANDWHALGALMLSSVLLVNNTIGFYRPALRPFLQSLATDLDLPEEFVSLIADLMECRPLSASEILSRIDLLPWHSALVWAQPPSLARDASPQDGPSDEELARVVDGVAAYVEATASVDRFDRLFPAHPTLYETNSLSIAYGACGVLSGLARMRGTVPDRFMGWVLSREADQQTHPPGLYLGLAGVAWTLADLGESGVAAALIDRARHHSSARSTHDILYGAAGLGMACLRFAEPGLTDEAISIGRWLAATCIRDDLTAHWSDPGPRGEALTRVGYARGASGVALFLLYLHLATGQECWYDLGRAALAFDLAQGVKHNDRTWLFPRFANGEPNAGDDLRGYWDEGTAGIATTALRYLVVRPESYLETLVPQLLGECCRKYAAFPQLFHGLAGAGNVLLDAAELLGEQRWLDEARRIAAGVLCFRIDRPEGIVFPGEQSLRESVDLASGSTGVALFLDRLTKVKPGATATNFNYVLDEMLPTRATPAGVPGPGRA